MFLMFEALPLAAPAHDGADFKAHKGIPGRLPARVVELPSGRLQDPLAVPQHGEHSTTLYGLHILVSRLVFSCFLIIFELKTNFKCRRACSVEVSASPSPVAPGQHPSFGGKQRSAHNR